MVDAASGGAGTTTEVWGGAGPASSALVAAVGRAEESEQERERVSEVRLSKSESEPIGFGDGWVWTGQ